MKILSIDIHPDDKILEIIVKFKELNYKNSTYNR
jgi:hypothetical protein